MSDSRLTELLQRAGDRTPVGAPPIGEMYTRATRRRRRRTVILAAGTAAVVALAGSAVFVLRPGAGPTDPTPPVASDTDQAVPAGLRAVGIGHAAITVPAGWASGNHRCGTPQADTVYVDPGAVRGCLAARPPGVESVLLQPGIPASKDFHADETLTIDGVQAERQRTRCGPHPTTENLCVGIVVIPVHQVTFRAESSTDAGEVDRMLRRITIMPDRIAVPGFLAVDASGAQPTAEEYAGTLRGLGLRPSIRSRPQPTGPKYPPPGRILEVSPTPGTMLASGAVVTITSA